MSTSAVPASFCRLSTQMWLHGRECGDRTPPSNSKMIQDKKTNIRSLEPCAVRTASMAHKPPLDRQAREHQCLTECQRVGDVLSALYPVSSSSSSHTFPLRPISRVLHTSLPRSVTHGVMRESVLHTGLPRWRGVALLRCRRGEWKREV